MEIEPIQQTDLSRQVYLRLKDMILSGKLKPGEKLIQEKIAALLGVSRMPLHKAFAMLEDEFLVESIPRRGIFIRKPDLRAIIEAFECREGLEGIAARTATGRLTAKEVDQLEALFSPFTRDKKVNMTSYQEADQAFHEAIFRASGNAIMQKLNSIGNVLIRTYPKGVILSVEESMRDHRDIINAFRKQDGELAEKLVRNHSRKAQAILKQKLDGKHAENPE